MDSLPPVIAITSSTELNFKDEPLMGTDCPYVEAIEAAGGCPLLVPITQDPKTAAPVLDRIDGILFSGGEDVHPRFYGAAPHEKLGEVNEARDQVELLLARLAFERNLPILGICRGLQLINVALGGTLYQDLPSDLPVSQPHRLPKTSGVIDEWSHPIRIQSESVLAKCLGVTRIVVNSTHHQAIKTLAPSLRAVAWAGDDVIEAIEAPAHAGFLIGVQSHPERLYAKHVPAWSALFKRFIGAASAFRHEHQTLPAKPKPG